MAQTPPEKPEILEKSILGLRDACWQRRMLLWDRAGSRQHWQRALQLTSGLITLISGGTVTALLATVSGAQTPKIVGAIVTILSGTLSLIVTTYFDVKETQKMFEGAAKYGGLRDQLLSLIDQRAYITPQRAAENLARYGRNIPICHHNMTI